ncbi:MULTISPECIES: tetratricopeptide repeat protein [Methylobacterium]|nr:tetratricopeptide repeat protein [Methylobacterium aquaticum]MBK3398704.1 tetratricopeptide repeat protein [Methylobacterium ajmalii]MBK3409434.1 tetratricopeptide repeat protein [Methylobacterium ajmalii]MBZ6412795.1 tetratricopeptide repeat protein [Methylobacterium sp.]
MMSENEFIREVNDEYRRDRLAQIWSRYSGVFIGLAVLVVLGVGGWRYWQHAQAQQSEAASLRFEEALRRAKDGTPEDAEKAFAGVVADAPFGYRLLARLRAAAEAGKADPAAGAKAYGTIADDSAVGQSLRDLARLRGALLLVDKDDAGALNSLQSLAAPSSAFRHTARETLGLVALKKGDFEGAGRWFDQIAADRETPAGLRQRLEIYVGLVAGGPVQVTAAAAPAPAAPRPPAFLGTPAPEPETHEDAPAASEAPAPEPNAPEAPATR